MFLQLYVKHKQIYDECNMFEAKGKSSRFNKNNHYNQQYNIKDHNHYDESKQNYYDEYPENDDERGFNLMTPQIPPKTHKCIDSLQPSRLSTDRWSYNPDHQPPPEPAQPQPQITKDLHLVFSGFIEDEFKQKHPLKPLFVPIAAQYNNIPSDCFHRYKYSKMYIGSGETDFESDEYSDQCNNYHSFYKVKMQYKNGKKCDLLHHFLPPKVCIYIVFKKKIKIKMI